MGVRNKKYSDKIKEKGGGIEMNYNIYTTGLIAQEMINDLKREAAKQRQWAQALRAKRQAAKS